MTSTISHGDKPQFVSLLDICSIQYGYAFDSKKFSENSNNGMPLVRIRDVVRGYTETYTSESSVDPSYLVNEGDLLIGMDGEFNIAKWKSQKALLNQRVCKLIPNDKVDADYLYYFMPNALKGIEDKTPFVTVKHLSAKELNKVQVPLPPIKVQEEISLRIGQVEKLISLGKNILVKLDLLIKSQFMEMFGDPILNPQKWKVQKLNDVCIKINDGTHFSPESFPHGEYKYITAKNIRIWGLDLTKVTYVSEEIHRGIYERCDPKKGDVLYIKDGATTGIAIVNPLDEEFSLLSSVALLRPNTNQLTAIYLRDFLNYPAIYEKIRGSMAGAAITRLTVAKIRQIEIPVPQLDLQKKYVIRREQIDKSKFAVEESIRKLELLKKALMQKYFG